MSEIHHNVLYAGMGRPCSFCKCFFMNSHDYNLHLKTGCQGLNRLGWAPSKYGDDGEVCSVERDVKLAAAVQQQGKITLGGFDYTLSGNGKWIVRHPARQ